MMFPVNRPASELTATELMNLYDETKCRHFARSFADADNIRETLKELRAEIERRMKPCDKQHYPGYQNQLAQQYVGNIGLGYGQQGNK